MRFENVAHPEGTEMMLSPPGFWGVGALQKISTEFIREKPLWKMVRFGVVPRRSCCSLSTLA